MRFARLAKAASFGLLGQLPIMGPIILAILKEIEQEASEKRMLELIHEMAAGRSPLEKRAPILAAALLQAEAEVAHQLVINARPQQRFLYLAADEYASVERTYEIAAQYGFLWRSFYKCSGESNANVLKIREGDLIALAYRVGRGRFKLQLPLVVAPDSPFTCSFLGRIKAGRSTDVRPFARANRELSILLKEDYKVDPCLKFYVGLPVKPLFADLATAEANRILGGDFLSPKGNNAIWEYNFKSSKAEVPPAVRDWIGSL